MTLNDSAASASARRELRLTRIFDAPRELVFQAWTDPQHLAQWWGPKDFTNPVCEAEARPGGSMRIHMRGPDGTFYPSIGVFQEVVPPERIVFTNTAIEDRTGVPILETLNTVTFAEQRGKTLMTLHVVVIKASPLATIPLAGMEEGWTQSLERLAALLQQG